MLTAPKPGHGSSFWLRCTALVCIVACLCMAAAQACHFHRPAGTAGAQVRAVLPTTAESQDDGTCPLCGSLHVTWFAAQPALFFGGSWHTAARAQLAESAPRPPMPFHLNSRPPPAS